MSYAYVPLLLRCRSFTHTCRRIENENSFLEFWPKGNLSYFYDFTYIYFCVYSSRFFGLNTKREMCVKRKSIRNCDLPTVSHTRHCALLKFLILSFCFLLFGFLSRGCHVSCLTADAAWHCSATRNAHMQILEILRIHLLLPVPPQFCGILLFFHALILSFVVVRFVLVKTYRTFDTYYLSLTLQALLAD